MMTRRSWQPGALAPSLAVWLGLAVVACAGALAWRAGCQADTARAPWLELAGFLEDLSGDLRNADALHIEKGPAALTVRFIRLARAGASPSESSYELTDGGRCVSRLGPGGTRRTYALDRASADADPLLVELSPDAKTLLVRGLGVRLQLPAPSSQPLATQACAAGKARFVPSSAAAERGGADGGLARPPCEPVSPGPDDRGLDNVAGGQTLPMQATTTVSDVTALFGGAPAGARAAVKPLPASEASSGKSKPAKGRQNRPPRRRKASRGR